MRLYLSSMNIGDKPEELGKLLGKNRKAAILINAVDYLSEQDRRECFAQELVNLSEAGIEGVELDLRHYFGYQHTQLELDLRQYGLVWVRGGNAFVLRRAMRQSGFDDVIRKLLLEDTIVYSGYSAGACVTAPTLKGIELVDDPTVVPEGYDPPVVWEGLGLVIYSIAPHYKSEHPESKAIDKVVNYFESNSMPYRVLSDGEAVTVNERIEA